MTIEITIMLQTLRIRDLAVLQEADLTFGEGFIAVTGETGAGKSVLLGALGLLAGARAEKSLIRAGAEACEVEGVLHLREPDAVDALLEGWGLPPCEEGLLLLRRVVSRERAPVVQINGRLATVGQMRELGALWLELHGPEAPQTLFEEARQREFLDGHAGLGLALADYREEFSRWRGLLAEVERLRSAERLDADQAAFLQAQLKKLKGLELSDEAIEQLESDHARVSASEEIRELSWKLRGLLGGAVADRLTEALREARALAELDPAAAVLADRVESASIELSDLGESFADVASACEFDPGQVEAISQRMERWLELKRKYGPNPASVRAKRDQLEQRLSSQGDVEGRIEELLNDAAKVEKIVRAQAEELGSRRREAAVPLAREVTQRLTRLGFKRVRFEIHVEREKQLREWGDTRVEFRFAANPGTPMLPLRKVASSGELARVMLALKDVLAAEDATPVLVFDEVDANVGGEIAVAVAHELATLGERHQVYCVTHLPQVASQAGEHFVVVKEALESGVEVRIEPLHGERAQRESELARMLGDRHAESAREHARELLRRRG